VPLRTLVLLNVVDQHFKAAVHPAVVQIETESPHFERFPPALVLAEVDSGVQLLEKLVVTGE